jgi:hypothetical protein
MSSLLQPLLDSNKVARVLGIEVETLGSWRRKGYGPPWYRTGKNVRYTETDLRIWMKAQARCGQSPYSDTHDIGKTETEAGCHNQSTAGGRGDRR